MFGAIAGDIIGSVFEANPIKTKSFPLFSSSSTFTDDTVLTIAIADAIINQVDYAEALKTYGRNYPAAGYGNSFFQWMQSSNVEVKQRLPDSFLSTIEQFNSIFGVSF